MVPQCAHLDSIKVVQTDKHFCEVIGYTTDEVLALGDHFAVTRWHPDDVPTLAGHRRRLQGLADGEIYEAD